MTDEQWVVVADSPFLPARGGGEREHLGFIRAARAAGCLAGLVIPAPAALPTLEYAEELGDIPLFRTPRRTSPIWLVHPTLPFVVASRPAPKDLAHRIRATCGAITGIVTFSYKSRLIGADLAAAFGVPQVLRQHNREGAYHQSLVAGMHGPRKLVMRWEAARITRDEARVDRDPTIAAIADISASDAAERRRAGAPRVIHVPPFAFDTARAARRRPPRSATAHRVLFVGALDVPTNISALRWFLTEVWPLVVAAAPDAALDIVGRAPSVDLQTQATRTAGVTLHADVPSLDPFLDAASVAINPAITGSGVNIKVIDYLQAGLPLVSTSLATAGLPLRAGVDLDVADSPAAFSEAIVRLLRDPARRAALAEAGREHIEQLLNPATNITRIAAAMDAARGH